MPGNEDDIDNCLNWDDKTLKDVVEANAAKYTRFVVDFDEWFLVRSRPKLFANIFWTLWRRGNTDGNGCARMVIIDYLKWEGMNCHYRHCLPQGYVLKRVKNNEKVRDER
jgi:hypothetical protein